MSSSSVTVAATLSTVRASQAVSVEAVACVTAAVSSRWSVSCGHWSCAALTVTVWAVLQLSFVRVSDAGLAVTSVLSVGSTTVTVTSWEGFVSRTTVWVPVPPSSTVREVLDRATPGVSFSVMVTPTSGMGRSSYCPPLMVWVMVTSASVAQSSSWAAETVMLWAVAQSSGVKVRLVSSSERSLPVGRLTAMLTSALGLCLSTKE